LPFKARETKVNSRRLKIASENKLTNKIRGLRKSDKIRSREL
jgi:pantothenate kinase